MDSEPKVDRRTVLEMTSVALPTALLAGCTSDDGGGSGGETTTTESTATESTTTGSTKSESQTVRLGAKTGGWVGKAPKAIAGKQNPTLTLTPGQQYTIEWTNLDGKEHELLVVDGSGKTLEKSDDAEEQGKTVSLTFTASKEMNQYYCEYHPQAMRGDVETGSGDGGTTTTTGE
ncbi:cupredoxin domain-containing protein [Halomicrococcus sp. SG-WS-1]|uniref:cupredoxin domain-containing protein n=1 Tax=Halomicrococcus sp. SG-WS-1 TaxID=3439057 RepID=UPI003F7AF8F0